MFAWCTVPRTDLRAFAQSVCWTWLYLLQFCLSNQSLSPDEDERNKPWRPLPSRRISIRHALIIRWTLLPLCIVLSVFHNITAVGLILTLGILLHNELRLDAHWFTRNVLNALGYAVFDAGATAIACASSISELPRAAVAAHYFSIAIVLTTIHAQDFQDEAGDRLEKRRTIPIVMPRVGRLSMPLGLTLWSIGLGMLWNRSLAQLLLLSSVGGLVGARFYYFRTPEADKLSYRLYNVWLAMVRITPMYA
ncbi:UbiA prenyltransferase family [Fomes fomentarius]|nr:UbiA prenyltransferase family [Fomes fomentarius]